MSLVVTPLTDKHVVVVVIRSDRFGHIEEHSDTSTNHSYFPVTHIAQYTRCDIANTRVIEIAHRWPKQVFI